MSGLGSRRLGTRAMGEDDDMGRTVLTDEVQEKLCELVAAGEFVHVACGLVGISEDSVARWLKRAAAHEAGEALPETADALPGARCAAFARSFLKAKAAGEAVYLDRIREKAERSDRKFNPADWKADAWILERLNPRKFGPAAHKLEHSGPDGSAVKVEVAKVVLFPAEDDSGSTGSLAPESGAAD